MDRLPSRTACALLAAASLSLLAAGPAAAHTKHVTKRVDLKFAAVAGNQSVSCGTAIPGLGTTNQSARLADLRFYVSNVSLIRSDGKAVPIKLASNSSFRVTRRAGAVTLIDLENGAGACAAEGTKATNAHVRGTVPAGRYRGLSYKVGVPDGLNHSDVASAPAPLNLAAMDWSWQAGRKFLKIETADPTFMVHLGSTGCTGNPATGKTVDCTSPNRVAVRLASFDPSRQQVAVDVKALLAGSDLSAGMGPMGGMATAAGMDMSGCMSGPGETGCAPVFQALGIGWSDSSGGGAAWASKQKVFRAIAR